MSWSTARMSVPALLPRACSMSWSLDAGYCRPPSAFCTSMNSAWAMSVLLFGRTAALRLPVRASVKRADAVAKALGDQAERVAVQALPGPGGRVLVEAARKLEADLIVVAGRGSAV